MRRSFVVVLVLAGAALAQPRPEPLADQVKSAIDRGVNFLRREERGRGHWDTDITGALVGYRNGPSALALLALLNAGVPPGDEMMQRALTELRKSQTRKTYVVALQTMVLAEINDPRDRELIQSNVNWLLKVRVLKDDQFAGWTYSEERIGHSDNSNSQYALLGLAAGRAAGAKVDKAIWEQIRDYYLGTQMTGLPSDEGGWGYITGRSSELTMTVAGLCGLEICAAELNKSHQGLRPDGTAENCGVYREDPARRKALEWLSRRFTFNDREAFYNAYGIERAGRLTGQRFLVGHDWYREGCELLVSKQRDDGSWNGWRSNWQDPIVNTSFSLLFLSKGRTPVLISKWAHGRGDEWNNKHSDARHLVSYASHELFRKQPLAWQVYDARHLGFGSRAERNLEVAALLQTPVLYMNGHVLGEMTDTQRDLLKQYLSEGGFLLAEACCGKEAFTRDFRTLMAKMFPEHSLKPLPPTHAVWRAHAIVPPGFVPLEGIDMGCKTVVVFSPKPISGYWEENLTEDPRGKLAFRLAGNIIAYATGMEAPKPRLTIGDIPDSREEPPAPRGFFRVAQLRHEGDWQPAPRAMSNLMRHVRERQRLDVELRPQELPFAAPDLFKYKFLYLHGRGRFSPSNEGYENLRANLQNGGTLLADACCGSPAFDAAFREFAGKLFPTAKLEPIPATDALFSAATSGSAIQSVRVRSGAGATATFENAPPALWGIKLEGRWAVIYSPLDLGCALEKHQSSDCKGHDYDSALRIATAAVMYSLKN